MGALLYASPVNSPHPLSRPFAAAIVDLDGTLVDTLGDFSAALNQMLRDLSQPPIASETVAGFIGQGTEHLLRKTLAHVGAPAELYPRALDHYEHAYRAINGRWSTVYQGAAEGLQALRARGLRLACLTNKPGEFARELLVAKGLAPFFELVFGGDAFERKKPDPLPLRKTCEALGTAPAATLMVGDSRNDAAAARAAGCPVVLVTYGYNHGEPVRSVDADGFLDSLAQIDTILRA
ncbi:MAG: phosphoglycolate phosphatase [Ramlibacter sp.]|nr:phosphoglycolate phosphatase [Ramlibacter sp.]